MRNFWPLKRQHDRLAVADYLLTGEIREDAEASPWGNVTWYSSALPHNNETILDTFPLSMLSQRCTESASIMDVASSYLMEQLEKLANKLRSGSLKVSLACGTLSLSAETLLASIRQFSPTHAFWTNLHDYFHPDEFWNIVAEMQPRSPRYRLTHVIHSCNWFRETWGCDLFDYAPSQVAQLQIDATKACAIDTPVLRHGCETEWVVFYYLCRKYAPCWVRSVFATEMSQNEQLRRYFDTEADVQLRHWMHPYNPLNTTPTALLIAFTLTSRPFAK